MRETRHFITVGIAFLLALVAVSLGIGWLRGALARYHTINVQFADAQGIKPGSEVRMAGVRIGSVNSVRLTDENAALLTLRIDDGFDVPQGSRFLINTSLLGGTPNLTVVPNKTSGAPIEDNNEVPIVGSSGAGIEMTLNDGRELMLSLRQTTDKLAQFANDPRTSRDLRETLSNLREATAALPVIEKQLQSQLILLSRQASGLITETQQSQRRLTGTAEGLLGTFDKSTIRLTATLDKQANLLSNDVRGTLNENRANLKGILASTNESVANLNGLLAGAKGLVADPELKQNLLIVTRNLAETTKRLDETTAKLAAFAGDPELTDNLKATTVNVREATANVRDLTARLAGIRIPGEKRPGTTPPPTSNKNAPLATLLEKGLTTDALYDMDADRFRLDANYTFLSGQAFYRVGLFDVTESNQLSLQAGRHFGESTAMRYGILYGKLGAGVDYRWKSVGDFRLDLFDPNHFTVNGRFKRRVGDGLSLSLGVDSLGAENRAVLGLQYRP